MKRCFYLIAFSLLFFSFCIPRTHSLRIGQRYTGKIVSEGYALKKSNTIDKEYTIKIKGIEYGFCNDQAGLIDFIFCEDSNLILDGVKVGDTYDKVRKILLDTIIRDEYNFCKYVILPSGWYARFGLSNSGFGEKPNIKPSEKIDCFYKR